MEDSSYADDGDIDFITLFDKSHTLTERIKHTHDLIFERYPNIVRIAFAVYDTETDLLKTYINSTKAGVAIVGYEYKLSDCESLRLLAKTGRIRVIDGINEKVSPTHEHSSWLLEQEYVSSLTIPVFAAQRLIGFLFFDATESGAFTKSVQRDLLLYSNFIIMSVSSEITSARLLLLTAKASKAIASVRDFETGKHLQRMSLYAEYIARHLSQSHGLSDEFIINLSLFAPLHDIGKIQIPDEILLKPGRLEPDERRIMESHVEKGCQILQEILKNYELTGLPDTEMMIDIVKYHHEFLDGSGYPQGFKGEQIPIVGRIIQVADIYDALTSARPYKKEWSHEEALEELETMAKKGKIDSDCVRVIRENPEKFKSISSIQDSD
jgi:HD-GYP domain-containing protein (c-di-GMP phosphodiesterase class II)